MLSVFDVQASLWQHGQAAKFKRNNMFGMKMPKGHVSDFLKPFQAYLLKLVAQKRKYKIIQKE